jgi:hypothetical protein
VQITYMWRLGRVLTLVYASAPIIGSKFRRRVDHRSTSETQARLVGIWAGPLAEVGCRERDLALGMAHFLQEVLREDAIALEAYIASRSVTSW